MAKNKSNIIKGVPPTEDDLYYLNIIKKEQEKSIERIEDVSKWLIGIITSITGLFGAGKSLLNITPSELVGKLGIIPFILWTLSIIGAVLVNFPFRYRYKKNVPESIKRCIHTIAMTKWWFLLGSALLFCLGVIVFVILFIPD